MKLTKKQIDNVDKVIKTLNSQDNVVFQAPTGAGKSLMSYAIATHFAHNNYVVFVSTLSTGNLHKQLYDKYVSYVFNVEDIRPPMLQLIDSTKYKNPDKVFIHSRTLPVIKGDGIYILGNASYKQGGDLKEDKLLEELLTSLKKLGKNVLHIKDESHIDASIDNVIDEVADKILHMSATPKNKKDIIVMSEEDSSEITKQELVCFESSSHTELLEQAYKDLQDIQDVYLEHNIRPAILVQVNNTNKTDKTYKSLKKEIVSFCNSHNLKWVTTFHDMKESWNGEHYSLEDIRRNDSEIDLIIFKTNISTGWDIPRATSLIQFRDVDSETLSTQTVGRIRRKPIMGSDNKILDKYFVYKEKK